MTTRRSSTPRTSGRARTRAPTGAWSRSSPREAPGAIHWLEELGVEFTRENGGYRLARCGGATRKRLLQVGDRTGHAITKALREAFEASDGTPLPQASADRARAGRERLARHLRRVDEVEVDAATVVLAAGGRCYREAEERGELSTNHPGATGEVTRDRARARRRDRATSTRSSTTRTAAPGRRTCRATRSRRRRAPTAPSS